MTRDVIPQTLPPRLAGPDRHPAPASAGEAGSATSPNGDDSLLNQYHGEKSRNTAIVQVLTCTYYLLSECISLQKAPSRFLLFCTFLYLLVCPKAPKRHILTIKFRIECNNNDIGTNTYNTYSTNTYKELKEDLPITLDKKLPIAYLKRAFNHCLLSLDGYRGALYCAKKISICLGNDNIVENSRNPFLN